MVLCLLERLSNGLDYTNMTLRFQRWAREGYMTAHGVVFDVGTAAGSVFQRDSSFGMRRYRDL